MPIRSTLFRKYTLIFGGLTGGSLLLSGLLGISFAYQESQLSVIKLQREKAEAAATRLGEYLFGIEQRIAVAAMPKRGVSALEQRSADIQILRRTAAIHEILLLDNQGKEYLRTSRRTADIVGSKRDLSTTEFFRQVKSGRSYRSPIYFRDGSLYMTIAMAVGPEEAGITVAEVDLEFLLDGITRVKVGDSGHAYAVDSEGRLIAHPDIGLVLRNTSMAALPQVQAAIKGQAQGGEASAQARNHDGEPVLTAFGTIPQLGWFVFVEEPLAEAYRPLYAQAIRSGSLVLIGMLLTVFACVALVRRVVKPIHALQDGATLIGRGVLDHRITVRTGDELEDLANGFNRMAEQLQKSYAMLEGKVSERTLELEEANNKLAALSTTDALTGLANRRRFDEVLASEWSRAARIGQPLALGLLDVDWFKAYNDRYGHQAGDECLRQVASVLSSKICRTGDLVARYGGEEFVFIAPATDAEQALSMARKVCQALQDLELPHAMSGFGCVTASVGVASIVPEVKGAPDILVAAADMAMYRAKEQGRNQAVLGG
ncbi:MAG: diguanylate cyclase [Candidatus Accumulibacter phosphatis]|jgi:diguanylate cyclase (GGDEF)-like protein|uniref:diguanylate cyclase n=1 Tax=Candidatus Accumulibacter contiguus TaxID=2954381 RepID=A0ABX1TAH7_9PROT|nr:diguanylate cyclase [Candidatus Accumulibacter contiguus]NMQ05516.1 diguanylate cyclase [Candidatus Accumulibacter contiguus]